MGSHGVGGSYVRACGDLMLGHAGTLNPILNVCFVQYAKSRKLTDVTEFIFCRIKLMSYY